MSARSGGPIDALGPRHEAVRKSGGHRLWRDRRVFGILGCESRVLLHARRMIPRARRMRVSVTIDRLGPGTELTTRRPGFHLAIPMGSCLGDGANYGRGVRGRIIATYRAGRVRGADCTHTIAAAEVQSQLSRCKPIKIRRRKKLQRVCARRARNAGGSSRDGHDRLVRS